MRRSSRILANTVASYTRLCFAALAGFVTVPIALRVLGAADYGIFAVIAGSLSFLMFINGALTAGAQRHIAHSIGRGDAREASRWLTLSVCVHSLLGAFILAVGYSASGLVLHHVLQIPPSRWETTLWIYHLVVVAMVCDVISTPYQAFLMARESIVVLAVIGMLGSCLLFAGTVSLKYLPGDTLRWYSAFYILSQITVLMGPVLFCIVRYPECRTYRRHDINRKRLAELLSFSGWNLFGSLSTPIRAQGPALVLNHFVGTVANAAYGIALQINGFTANVSTGLLRATSPAIVKAEAAGDRRGMISLTNLSSKAAFVILWLAIGPVLVDMKFVLTVWLSRVPANTGFFAGALLCALLIDQVTSGIGASIQAYGKIGRFQVVVSLLTCMSVPVGYLLVAHGLPLQSVLYAVVFFSVAAGVARVSEADRIFADFAKEWTSRVFVPCTLVVTTSFAVMELVASALPTGVFRLMCLALTNLVTVSAMSWSVGLASGERETIRGRLRDLWEERRGRRVVIANI